MLIRTHISPKILHIAVFSLRRKLFPSTKFPRVSRDETAIPRVEQPSQNIPVQEFQEVNRHRQQVPLGSQAHVRGGVGTLAERVHDQRAV